MPDDIDSPKPFSPPESPLCAYCLDFGIAPLPDDGSRSDWAVCLCKAGQRWRHDTQTDPKRRLHKTVPMWVTWAGEWGIGVRSRVRSGACADTGSVVDLVENYYPASVIIKLYPKRATQ